jgi:hypothetical protein
MTSFRRQDIWAKKTSPGRELTAHAVNKPVELTYLSTNIDILSGWYRSTISVKISFGHRCTINVILCFGHRCTINVVLCFEHIVQ